MQLFVDDDGGLYSNNTTNFVGRVDDGDVCAMRKNVKAKKSADLTRGGGAKNVRSQVQPVRIPLCSMLLECSTGFPPTERYSSRSIVEAVK